MILPVLLAISNTASGLTLEELKLSFEVRREQIDKVKTDAAADLRSKYVVALERIKGKAQDSGDLEGVLLIKEEIDTVNAGKSPIPPLPAGISKEVQSMRKIFAKQVFAIEKKWAKDTVVATDKMAELLDKQVVSLTKAGNLEDAKNAKAYKDTLDADQDILSARALYQNVSNDGKSRAAMRIRRHGDNIEVLVSYDGRGKISMDSPITNVREKGSKGGGKADTAAKTLGEFVGAKGYTVDSYVSYHKVLDGEDVGQLVFGDTTRKLAEKADGERGVSVKIMPKRTNPHGSINQSLPGTANKGSFKISTRYFIPKENKALRGFWFVHGAGSAIGRKNFEKRGAWTADETSGESTHSSEQLVIQFLMEEGKTYVDAQDDMIIFGEFKVEQTKFSAYIVTIYDAKGEPVETSGDTQKTLVQNGELFITPRALERLLAK